MKPQSPEVQAAQHLTANAGSVLGQSAAFRQLDTATQSAILGDLGRIHQALSAQGASGRDPYALSLETPEDFYLRHRRLGAQSAGQGDTPATDGKAPAAAGAEGAAHPRAAATETLAARAGALSDEINFPAFVASLVHGTFDAIVDATIRQMEAFANLVSAVAKDVDQFTSQNVTPNQVRDWLAEQYPKDLQVVFEGEQPRLRARATVSGDGSEEPPSPTWLADYGLEGQPLTDDVIEEQLIPVARRRVGENRLQMLATMVLLGMSRVNVKDGSISAKVRFRALAQDKAQVNYATSADPGPGWGDRGSTVYSQPSMMVSTVGVNVQADTELKAELFGEVRINFLSETLPLDRFADSARITLLQRNSRSAAAASAAAGAPAATPAPALAAEPVAAPAVAPPAKPASAAGAGGK